MLRKGIKAYPATSANAFLLGALRNPTVSTDAASRETTKITSFTSLLLTYESAKIGKSNRRQKHA
jgi:hypothetical protein